MYLLRLGILDGTHGLVLILIGFYECIYQVCPRFGKCRIQGEPEENPIKELNRNSMVEPQVSYCSFA